LCCISCSVCPRRFSYLPLPHSLFFLMLRRPVTSPLFPYTTLFRSQDRPRGGRPRSGRGGLRPGRHPRRDAQRAHALEVPSGVTTDRKSTRLNSSHVSISYAVFCLKKKRLRQGRAGVRGGPCRCRSA